MARLAGRAPPSTAYWPFPARAVTARLLPPAPFAHRKLTAKGNYHDLHTQTIPLDKLVAWPGNVRKTNAAADIEELAASIVSHGLLKPLLVRKHKRGYFHVVAGGRRLLALQSLATSERIDGNAGIECRLAAEDASLLELSLAENVVRTAMHPADEFEAFRDLVENDAERSAIAQRFGVSLQHVEKRLKLGRLSPVILQSFRNGELGLEEALAFTLGADHETQERVLKDLPPWQCKPSSIRRALTPGEVPASDPRVQLVGLEAYALAGGGVRRDLIDDENEGYVQDEVLLDSLTFQRLKAAAEPVETEGWAWVECALTLDYGALSRFSRVYPTRGALPADTEAELERLQAECDALAGHDNDDAEDRRDAAIQRIEEIETAAECYTTDQLSRAGAVLSVGYHGEIEIRRGLVRPSDAKAPRAPPSSASETSSGEKPPSSALIAELSAQKTAALAATLSTRADLALAVAVHALATPVFYPGSERGCVGLRLVRPDLERSLFAPDRCNAVKALASAEEAWRKRLPGEETDLLSWCLAQPQETLLGLVAFLTALSIDVIESKHKPCRRIASAALAKACDLDLARWYRPAAETYFAKVPRASIVLAVEEATGKPAAPGWLKLKRGELAKKAEKLVAPTKWLPAPLRCDPSESAT